MELRSPLVCIECANPDIPEKRKKGDCMKKITEFEDFTIPSTYAKAESLYFVFRDVRIKAINELKMLHRDPESSEIHCDHPSSTGLYRLPQVMV